MEKTATLNLRVNPEVKKQAESILSVLGVPMSVAVDMFLKQINLTGGIPFSVTIPKAPPSINADLMTAEEIHAAIDEGYKDMQEGRVENAEKVFSRFKERHGS